VGADQAVEGQHRQRRRAIDQHEVIVRIGGGQGLLQPALAALLVDQLDLRAGQLAVGAQHVVAAQLGAGACLGDGGGLDQHVVDRGRQGALVHPRPHGRIALRVEVDQQHPLADLGQPGGEVDGGGRLADAAFLVGNAEDLGHAGGVMQQEAGGPRERSGAVAVSGGAL